MSASGLSTLSPAGGGARPVDTSQRAARANLNRLRRPLFGRYGHAVVASLCAYEVAAIATGRLGLPVRLPTLTAIGRRYPAAKWALSGALAHHFHIEQASPLNDIFNFVPRQATSD